jgi:hypothetical protein
MMPVAFIKICAGLISYDVDLETFIKVKAKFWDIVKESAEDGAGINPDQFYRLIVEKRFKEEVGDMTKQA